MIFDVGTVIKGKVIVAKAQVIYVGEMRMEKGDIAFLDYDAWFVDIGGEKEEMFDTTNPDHAKEGDIFNEKEVYKPRPFICGAEGILKGLGEALLDAEVDKEYDIEIPPENAFGEKDPKLVEVHSKAQILRLPEFRESKEAKEPSPGMEIQLKGKLGRITMVTAGRVRVDFNHRLAGRALKYKYKIVSVAKEAEERVKAVISIYYGREDDFKVEIDGDTAKIVLADICKYDTMWHSVKIRVISDLREFAGMNTVQLIEEYQRRKEEEKEETVEVEPEAEVVEERAEEKEG